MASRNNIASRYLDSIHDDTGSAPSTPSSTRLPLQPTSKFNSSPIKNDNKGFKNTPKPNHSKHESTEEDLDRLAQQLNVNMNSPSKTALLRTRFESHSATVSSFKTPQSKTNSNNSSKNGSPGKVSTPQVTATSTSVDDEISDTKEDDGTPSWAKGNYRDVLNKTPKAGNTKQGLSTKTPSTTSKNLHEQLKTPATNNRLNSNNGSPLKLNTPGTTHFIPSTNNKNNDLSSTLSKNTQLAPSTPSPSKQKSKPRSFLSSPSNSTSRDSPGYEYLCRILAIKNWLEPILQEEITQEPVELITYIRNGIHIAKLANLILPLKRNVFTNDSKLQFRHTENINRFFQLLDFLNVPDLFRFELTDLYDAKNVPKVWFCLHAMSYMLAKLDSNFGQIQNLVDEVDFSEDDIRTANRSLVGCGLPNFTSADTGDSSSPSNGNENSYLNRTLSVSPMKAVPYQQLQQQQLQSSLPGRDVAISKPNSPKRTAPKMVDACVETDRENPFRLSRSKTFEKSTDTSYSELQNSNLRRKVEKDVQIQALPPRPRMNELSKSTEAGTITDSKPKQSITNRYEQFLHETGQYADDSGFTTAKNSVSRKFTPSDFDYTQSEFYTPEIENYIGNIVKVQALAKGASFRYTMFIDRILIRSYAEEFTNFQSIIRGNFCRGKTIYGNRDDLIIFNDEIIALQSVARAKLLRNNYKIDLSKSEDPMITLQSIIRGHIQRQNYKLIKDSLFSVSSQIQELQCITRRHAIYAKCSIVLENIDYIEGSVLSLQSVARRILFQRITNNNIISGLSNSGGVVQLQSLIRGNQVRFGVFKALRTMFRNAKPISELQSIARGGIARTKLCNNVLITLMGEDDVMNSLLAKARGNLVRRDFIWKKQVLNYIELDEVVPIQSVFRGILSRFEREIKLDDIYGEVDSVISFQGIIRGTMARRNMIMMFNYYTANINKVIRAQAIIKSKFTHRAYKSLLGMKNPPLSVIKRFAYLLTDNDIDYQEEMEVSDIKDRIIEKSKTNEELESQIENLDIKLSLLDKNKITVEDFIKHKNKYKVYKPANTAGVKNLERLNKSSRERIELYQSMFYFLQTKSSYFIRLYNTMNSGTKNSENFKELQNLIVLLFPIRNTSVDHHSREEYFYIKFIFAMMKNDITVNAKNISDLTKAQSSIWVEFFLQINNHSYQRQHLKMFMGKIVTHVIETDEISFESDPSVINDSLAEKELKVHGSTTREKGVSPQMAINDPEVSAAFVENLLSLREYATGVFEVLQNSVDKIPVHVRLIAKESYRLSQLQFPEKNDQQHLAVAGVIFIKHYIATIFQYPENFGFLAKDPFNADLYNTKAKDNLKHLSRVILQVFSMKTFSDNFLKPLNDYVTSSVDMTRSLITKIIDVKDIEYEYELNDYDDIITHERPKLLMKVSDMILIEKIVAQNIDIMAPSSDDQLFSVSAKLEDLVNTADDLVSLTELGSITLNLNPTTKEDSLADSKAKSLFTQAKRCILYIIRIQDGDGLLELLISRIQPEHEEKFRRIVDSERREAEASRINEKRKPYYKTSLGNLSTLTYRELKKMALEIILQLEGMGQLSRENSFQDILNQIAVDIKTKDAQRISRKSQLEIATKTIEKLLEKEKFLGRQLNDYNKHIESILAELQLKPKDKKIFNIIPVFSKQYFYHRELRKHNRLPKFGSYIYSVKKLLDQKILLDFGGLVGQKFASSSKLDFMFSCHEVGKFVIEAASGSVNIPGAFNTISLDQLLNYQYENKERLELFSGMVKFNTQNLTAFIFKRFYDLKKD